MSDHEDASAEFARLRADYRRRGYAARVGFGSRPAVLVVDFATAFTDPHSPLGTDLAPQLAATATLVADARAAGAPVVFSTIIYDQSLTDAGLWRTKIPSNSILTAGSAWTQIDPRVAPLDTDTVLVKKRASSFFGTDLADRLAAWGVDTLLVCGCTTSGCVRASVVDACSHDLHTIVVEEAVGDRAELPHQVALFDMDAKYADVVRLQQARDYLYEAAGVGGR